MTVTKHRVLLLVIETEGGPPVGWFEMSTHPLLVAASISPFSGSIAATMEKTEAFTADTLLYLSQPPPSRASLLFTPLRRNDPLLLLLLPNAFDREVMPVLLEEEGGVLLCWVR